MRVNTGWCRWLLLSGSGLFILLLSSCTGEELAGPTPNGNTRAYPIESYYASGIDGNLTLAEMSDGSVSLLLELEGDLDEDYAAKIRYNNAIESGEVVLSLNTVTSYTGSSKTIVRQSDQGLNLSYQQFLQINAHIIIRSVISGEIVAWGDIGQNSFTGDQVNYSLKEVDSSGISGEVLFRERLNGQTLVQLWADGKLGDKQLPSQIELTNDLNETVTITLNPVNPARGNSLTNVRSVDPSAGGKMVRFDDLLHADGKVLVQDGDMSAVVAQGGIGKNAE